MQTNKRAKGKASIINNPTLIHYMGMEQTKEGKRRKGVEGERRKGVES